MKTGTRTVSRTGSIPPPAQTGRPAAAVVAGGSVSPAPALSAKQRDREMAKERMRRLRGAAGTTANDRARNKAVGDLIANHKAEFQQLYWANLEER